MNARRGQITGMETEGTHEIIRFVPLAAMFGYATDPAQVSGKGYLHYAVQRYDVVPPTEADDYRQVLRANVIKEDQNRRWPRRNLKELNLVNVGVGILTMVNNNYCSYYQGTAACRFR